jgi:hypothetical protein
MWAALNIKVGPSDNNTGMSIDHPINRNAFKYEDISYVENILFWT